MPKSNRTPTDSIAKNSEMRSNVKASQVGAFMSGSKVSSKNSEREMGKELCGVNWYRLPQMVAGALTATNRKQRNCRRDDMLFPW